MFAAYLYIACGAVRLARFNVLARQEKSSEDFFTGLPIPAAASMLVAMVIAHFRLFEGLPVKRHILILALVILLATLMVSSVSFWTFKNVNFGKKTIIIIFSLLIMLFIAGKKFPMSVILVSLLGIYILAGVGCAGFRVITGKKID